MIKQEAKFNAENARCKYEHADLLVAFWNRKLATAKRVGNKTRIQQSARELNFAQQNRTIAGLRLKAAEKKLAAFSPARPISHETRLTENEAARARQSKNRTASILRNLQASGGSVMRRTSTRARLLSLGIL